VTLSVINWGWFGTATYTSIDSTIGLGIWGLVSGDKTGGGDGTKTSFLPEWSGHVSNGGWVAVQEKST